MRLRFLAHSLAASGAFAAAMALAAPASAQDMPNMPHLPQLPGTPGVLDAAGRIYNGGTGPDYRRDRPADPRPEWRGDARGDERGQMGGERTAAYPPEYMRARDEWLSECRRNRSDDGVGGGILGALFGGLLGNRIAGRHDRTLGTVAGAAVGAVAGAAIDKAEDRGRARDYCEAYLDRYAAPQGGYGPAYGQQVYAVPMMMVPAPRRMAAQNCTETVVTEEWVTVPHRHRYIPPRRPPVRVIHDKRVRIIPDKRVRTN